MRQPVPTAHGDSGGMQPKVVIIQGLLGDQVRTIGSDVASLTQAIEEYPRNSAERAEGRLV